MPVEVVNRILRQSFGRLRVCYEQGLSKNPSLAGRLSARFVIGRDGAVSSVADGGSDLADGGVVRCALNAVGGLSFPQPEGGIVTVVFPVMLEPGGGGNPAAPVPAASINVNVFVGPLPRKRLNCSAAASAPLEERAGLWRECARGLPLLVEARFDGFRIEGLFEHDFWRAYGERRL